MNFFRHRHVVVAALVAPVLALIAWFSLDFFMGESPHVAVEGMSYPLVEKPNCRYDSGFCGLKNNDFELDLSYQRLGGERLLLELESVYPLEGVRVAVVRGKGDEAIPVAMNSDDPAGLRWKIELSVSQPQSDRLRLATTASGAHYFGDVALKFTLADRKQTE